MPEVLKREGGCLCGAVRYRLLGESAAEGAGYCHCRRCQLSTGAPVVAWVTYPKSSVEILQGQPKTYKSSPKAVRQFCPDCGTQLFFGFTEGPPDIDISVASLDQPELMPPTYHIWTASRMPWLAIDDNLPRFEDDGDDFTPYTRVS